MDIASRTTISEPDEIGLQREGRGFFFFFFFKVKTTSRSGSLHKQVRICSALPRCGSQGNLKTVLNHIKQVIETKQQLVIAGQADGRPQGLIGGQGSLSQSFWELIFERLE